MLGIMMMSIKCGPGGRLEGDTESQGFALAKGA